MKKMIFNNYKYFLSVIIMLFFLMYCDDNSSKNEEISDNNISKLKSLQDTVEVDQQEITTDLTSRINEISDSLFSLEQTSKVLNDSLNFYTFQLTDLDIKIDDLSEKKKYVSETDQKAKSKMTTKITELEALINSLKISKSKEENNLNKIGKKIELITKKSELLRSELEFKQIELNELYTKTDAQNQIDELTKQINEINNEIKRNKNLLLEEDLNENLSASKITNLETEISKKQKQFKTEYEKSTGIKDYVESEVEDLVYKLNNLEIKKAELIKKWKGFKIEKDKISFIHQNLQDAKNELLNLNQTNIQIDSTKSNKELVSSNTKKKQNEKELSNTQKLLEANEEPTENSSSLFYWFILIIIAILIILYWLGKKNKKNNSTKDLGEENE